MKRPAFQFYAGDWQRDISLRACSVAARGCWIEMMCLMHQAEPYGHLMLNGRPIEPEMLANMLGAGTTAKDARRWLAELEAAGVFSRNSDGSIFSRRMVRDEAARDARAEGGKAGSEHGAKGAEHGRKGGRPRKETGVKKPPFIPPSDPPPSSSSSSSTSTLGHSDPSGSGGQPPPVMPVDVIFANGVALLTAAGLAEKNARSMLGLMRKQHSDEAVVAALQRCATERPLEPVAFLQGVLRINGKGKAATTAEHNAAVFDQFARGDSVGGEVVDAGH